MTSRRWTLCLGLCFAASACTDAVPTSEDPSLIPIDPETFAVELPFSAFASELQTYSGFGDNADLPFRYVAHQWEDELDAHTLVRFGALPAFVTARPIDQGTTVQDSMYVPVSGELVLQLDSSDVFGPNTVALHAEALLSPWDPGSATWTEAVDTVGTTIPWPEPGGGPVRPVGVRDWLPAITDTVIFQLDSATVNEWTDRGLAARGVRVRTTTEGVRVPVLTASLLVDVRPSVNPDTIVTTAPQTQASTFLYEPDPGSPPGVIQIGGVPAQRAVLRLNLPETVDPGGDVCERVECPVELRPERILYAGLGLYTHAPVTPAFMPLDSVPVEVRPVLVPERLPRSPLGCSLRGCAAPAPLLAPEFFTEDTQSPLEFTLTGYLRALVSDFGEGETPPSSTLAILAGRNEPASLAPAVFYGPGTEFEPYLRLILTLSEGLTLP